MMISPWALLLVGIENFVLINTVVSALAFFLIGVVRVSGQFKTWHPLGQSRLYASALVFPTLFSGWLVLASLVPVGWLNGPHWNTYHEESHSLHLLNALTSGFDPVLEYSTLLFLLGATLTAGLAALRVYFRIGSLVRCLELSGEPVPAEHITLVKHTCHDYGLEVGLVHSRRPFSFVWGYFKSKLIVSTGLLNSLTREELAALLEHEAAHHRRRDNLLKWLLTLCRYSSFAFPLTNILYGWWSHSVEMICDEVAATRTHPLAVAEALVKIKRMASTFRMNPQAGQSAFFGDAAHHLEHRIHHLVGLLDSQEPVPVVRLLRSWTGSALWLSLTFGTLLLMVFAVSPLAIHRLLEQILHQF
ncbi:MAG TPA: M56 family metallopeptidase [Acidobacteriota bacterium]|nr:M56 family metallopeptidase [Acidobacteriota bacterium]